MAEQERIRDEFREAVVQHTFGENVLGEGEKKYDYSPLLFRVAICTATHPIEYSKTLMQIGYEPLPPVPSFTLLGRPCLLLMNNYKFIQYIKDVDGISGCYRGLLPRILQQSLFVCVHETVSFRIRRYMIKREILRQSLELDIEEDPEESTPQRKVYVFKNPKGSTRNRLDEDYVPTWLDHVKSVCRELVSRVVAITVSYPLHVIAVRTMAEFIGRECTYSRGVMTGALQIYRESGVLGFYKGLVPKVLGETIHIVLVGTCTYIIRSHINSDEARACLNISFSVLIGALTYPFSVVSQTMAVSGSSLNIPMKTTYKSWMDCWAHLSSLNQLRRGSSFFLRYFSGPTFQINGKLIPTRDIIFGPAHSALCIT